MSKNTTKSGGSPTGLADGQGQPPIVGAPAPAPGKMAIPPYVPCAPPPRVRAKVGPGGRVVIPAAFRAAAGMEEGADIMLTLHGAEVRIITPMASLRRVQEEVMKRAPPGVSLVDELIADRIAEEKWETGNG